MIKSFLFLFLCFCFGISSQAQAAKSDRVADSSGKEWIVEAACGQCKFGLPGKSCDLAIRMDSTAYFVDGTDIDSHGDAHAEDGFCNAIRKAKVKGEIINNRFKATRFELIKPIPGNK